MHCRPCTLGNAVAPARERGLKFAFSTDIEWGWVVAPARERGLKCNYIAGQGIIHVRRSREGAWIEIPATSI